MPPRRLEGHPLTSLERGRKVIIHHNGRPVEAYGGEPVAVALFAAGRTTLSRSMRYHRARGYFCGNGGCTHCFQRIDGMPNARGCMVGCHANTWVEDQNALPNARFDVLAAADLAYPGYLDAHRAFIRPTFLRPIFTRVIRAMAGYGKVPATPVPQVYRQEKVATDVCVVGSGPAGLAAAESAARSGARVLLLEREARLGGRLRHLPTPFHRTSGDAPAAEGKGWAREAEFRLRSADVRILTRTTLFGIYPDGRVAAASPTSLVDVQAKRIVLAVGCLDGYTPFPGSDRAGVLLAEAASRLLNEHGVLPGNRVAVVGATRQGLFVARDLMACGARVRLLADPRAAPLGEDPLRSEVERLGAPVRWNVRPLAVRGRQRPRALVVADGEARRAVDVDAVVLATGRHPAIELFQQAGCALEHHAKRGGFHPRTNERLETNVPNVLAAGSVLGLEDEWSSHLTGRLAGLAAAHAVLGGTEREHAVERAREALAAHAPAFRRAPMEVPA